jgi:hypothetical protein
MMTTLRAGQTGARIPAQAKYFRFSLKSTEGLWDPPNGDWVKIGCDGDSERKVLYLYTPQLLGQEQIYFLMLLLHQNLTSLSHMANDIFTGV